jgi:hypothetical protein
MSLRSARFILLLPFLAVGFLHAQVDSRLQAAKTDVLDVYFGSVSTGAPPEIITLVDNSQSMTGVYWSRYYYADADSTSSTSQTGQSWHNNGWGVSAGDFNNRLTPVVYSSGSGSSVQVWVNLHPIGGGTSTTPSSSTAISGLRNGVLIKPNGDPVTYTDVNSTDPKLWVQRASHVRFAFYTGSTTTYTYTGTGGATYGPYACNQLTGSARPRPFSGGNYTSAAAANIATSDQIRVVDFPLPWALFDPVPYYEGQNRTLSPAPNWPSSGNGGYSTAVANKHPQHLYFFDKVPDSAGLQTSKAQYYDADVVWSQGYSGVDGIMNPWTGATNAKGKIGSFHYNADYLWWIAFGQDVRNQSGTGAYINGMVDAYNNTNAGPLALNNAGGYSVKDVRAGGSAWNNGLPGMTRFQAIKRCLVQTWLSDQQNVQWAIRFLFGDPSGSSAPTQFNSNNQDGNPGDRMLLKLTQPTSANIPDVNMQYLLTMVANSNTPLTNAVMNAYAQFANTSNGNSIFNQNPPPCTRSFLIILSDGAPTDDGGSNDPYATGVSAGNTYVNLHPSYLSGTTGGSSNFNNFFTAAGIAAHYPASSSITGMPGDTYNAVKAKVPWVVSTRPTGVTRRVSTMTIGVSLEGRLTDTYGAKKGMYAAALYGWEKRTTPWDINNNPPAPYDPSDSTASDKVKNPFFFDATDPDKLSDALSTAFSLARTATNTLGAPVAPLVGLSIGKQTYIGTFTTSDGSVWNGDLLMSGLSVNGNNIQVLDRNGSPVDSSTGLSAANAAWSASAALASRGWKNRNIYTLTPGSTAGTFTNTLLTWNEGMSTASMPNSQLGLAASDTAGRLNLIRFMMGASTAAQTDTASTSSITTTRSDLMGDIINSTPTVLEFPLSAVPSGGVLASFVSNFGSSLKDLRFRLILVGDNQGLLHAFGEVSGIPTTTGTVAGRALVQGVVEGEVDELWAFLPPDLLSGLQTWRTGTTHRYLVDGSPALYLNERGTPNGMVDGTDFARVLFGLRKGGRSYYCLKFTSNDPSQPQIDWKLRPDEISPSDATLPNATVKKMGFSSSTPTLARIMDGSTLKDVFLIGGGLTTTDMDSAFSVATSATPPGYGAGTKLGRSVLAINVADGSIVKTWDFVNDGVLSAAFPSMGCIPSAVTPVEAIVGSASTQRVYFADGSGSTFVLGAMPASGSRTDTRVLSGWSVRRLYTPKYSGTPISVTPVVFPLPYGYPVTRSSAPTAIVPTFGVAFGTGDRNDPMDLDTVNPGGGGTTFRNRFVMVLDRQDSADITGTLGKVDTFGFNDDDLSDLTAIASSSGTIVDPTNTSYYLKTKFGYFLNFTVGQQKTTWTNTWQRYAYQKSITSPIVLNKVLFFTHFTPDPTASVCSGSGTSKTYRMCDVLNPVYNSGTVQATGSICNGYFAEYNDISSELAGVGLAGVLQAGEVKVTDASGTTGGVGAVAPIGGAGRPPSNMPKPRSWRIIR